MRPDGEGTVEPAVLSEELARIVDEARRVPLPKLEASAEQIHRAWWEHRARRRRRAATVGLLAAATLAALFFGLRPQLWERSDRSSEMATAAKTADSAESLALADRQSGDPMTSEVVLAADVEIAKRTDTTHDAVVLGPREVRLTTGSYEITVTEHAAASLVVRLPDGHIELVRGVVVAAVDGPTPKVTLLRGQAQWVHADGTRTELVPTAQTERQPRPARSPSPPSLAERADELLARGDRDGAIEVLERLLREHPNAASARGATLDLARLLKAAGQRARARCAYSQYLARWPYSQLRDDVESALRDLGEGPGCNGLDPKK
jgi:ferric-dicitrate binding protein FerR (iron transport regulator)